LPRLDSFRQRVQDNLNQLAQGIVEYEQPRLLSSTSRIEISLHKGEVGEGSFELKAPEGAEVSGLISVSGYRLSVDVTEFSGDCVTVNYKADSTGLDDGDVSKGEVTIISSSGETAIPWVINVRHSAVQSSAGPVRNLFHFVNLAQTNFSEAVELFYSDKFEGLLVNNDRQYLGMYRGFRSSERKPENVENFLTAVRKKTVMSFSISGSDFDQGRATFVCTEDTRKVLKLMKSGWGLTDIDVTIDSDFVTMMKTHITEDDFVGNTCELDVFINHALLHAGKNYAKIIFKTGDEEFYAEIDARRTDAGRERRKEFRMLQAYKAELIKNYLEFRIRNISKATWLSKSDMLTQRLLSFDDRDVATRLFRAHVLLSSERRGEASEILRDLSAEIASASPAQRGYFLYLSCLETREKSKIKENCEKVRRLYLDNRNVDVLLWMLLYLDEELIDDPYHQLIMLRHQCDEGGRSPLLYLEAYHILANDPALLSELGRFQIQVINFAIKTQLYSLELTKQIVYLAEREKEYNPVVMKLLCSLYDIFQKPLLLSAVCAYMIKGQRTDEEAFAWYARAVSMELRITRLFEYYLYSIPMDYAKELPKIIQLYFRYPADVDDGRKGFLYSNIIQYHSENPQILEIYEEQIEDYSVKMVSSGRINRNLSVIYRYMMGNSVFAQYFREHVTEFVFMHRLSCTDDRVRYIIIVEGAMKEEKRYAPENGEVFAPIYGRDYEVLVEYESGIRKSGGNLVYDEALFRPSDYRNDMMESAYRNPGVCVFLSEYGKHYVSVDNNNCNFVRVMIGSEVIRESFKSEYRSSLMQYYYDHDCMTELDECLSTYNLDGISGEERVKVIEFMVRREMWHHAYLALRRFGSEGISPKLALKLASRIISDGEAREKADEKLLLHLAFQAFNGGKYNDTVLRYLMENRQGTIRFLRNVWKVAREYSIDTRYIEERIITQMLFTRSFVGDQEEIFDSYVHNTAVPVIEAAYLTYNAYDFIVRDKIIDDKYFARLVEAEREGLKLNDLCHLAFLLFYSEKWSRRENVGDEIVDGVIRYVHGFLEKRIVLGEFMAFSDVVPELSIFEGRRFVQYKASPGSIVTLHYMLDGDEGNEEYRTETMRSIMCGIYEKDFLMFFGESLQYYITEEKQGETSLTESLVVENSDVATSGSGSRYEVINDMLLCSSMKEDNSLLRMMDVYRRKKYVSEHIFKLQ